MRKTCRWTSHRMQELRRDDRGVGLIIVMQFVLVAAALGTLVTVAATFGKNSATKDAAGASAQSTTDAGVAEAINFIRSNGTLALTCSEPISSSSASWQTVGGCTTVGWADPLAPVVVSGGTPLATGSACTVGQDCFKVWIGTLQTYTPARGATASSSYTPPQPGVYRIHSTGISGAGSGGRSVTWEVKALPTRFPFGVFANSFTMPASHSPAASESIFTTGDVQLKCPLSGLDYANNIPAAVHAAGTLTYSAGSCHAPSNPTVTCNTNAPYDQDSHGASWAGASPCYNYDLHDSNFSSVGATITAYTQSSFFDTKSLASYGYRPGGLSAQEYQRLKAQAQAEGTYNNHVNLAGTITSLVANGVSQPVIYFDDNSANPLGADPSSVLPAGFFRNPTSSNCPASQALIVVKGAVTIHWTGTAGSSVAASIFVPDTGGLFDMNGTAGVIGTLFADNVHFNGNGLIQLDQCFVANPPGGILDVTTTNFRSVDTTNVQ